MARRKQPRPKHLENSEEIATSLQNGICSASDTEDDEHVCGKCRAEFPSLSEFLQHKKSCVSKRPVLVAPLDSSMDTEEDDDPDDLDDRLSPPQLNNERNDNDRSLPPKDWFYGYSSGDIRSLLLCSQRPDSNVTLEQLKNTTVAVAQHSQFDEVHLRAFFSKFHQQQVESLQLIKTLEKMLLNSQPLAPPPLIGTAALTPPQNADLPPSVGSVSTPITSIMAAYPQGTTQESPGPPIPPPETNNLALLEKQTERYIQDVMTKRSFLINGIDDDNRSKNKKFEMDPAMRHRCNFCGKLLGSDSALQIHLRSHTGEKPFRCNVCGSAFSTRGNLKVHCQRHKERMELVGSAEEPKLSTESNAAGTEEKQSPSMLFVHDGTNRGDTSKGEQALDFSTSINGRRSPQGDANSRSISPNDMSNFSDNSADNSSDENTANDNYGDLKIDVERFDDDDRDNSNGLDDEGSEAASTRPSFGPSPTFSSYFLPSSYDNFTASASQTTGNNNNNPSNTDGSDTILQDPTYYQDLLPRIGSNDNSWESLIEVTKTSETSKLQQLVDNIEHKLIEPNQCIICHRVLSCKSALQMHYRTHTGERPFKCKLCSRAFTTKGNLKTHMGVHRTKPAARLMHQCPVCHKQFPNSVILQQHIRIHTGDPSVQMPPLYHSCEDRPPTLLPPSYPRQYLMPPQLMNNEPLALTSSKMQEQQRSLPTSESVIKTTGMDANLPQTSCASPELSATSSCSPSSNVDENSTLKEPKPPVLDLVQPHHDMSPKEKILQSPVDNSKANEMNISQGKEAISGNSTPADIQPDFEANLQRESSTPNHNQSPVSVVASQEGEDKSPTNMSNKSSPKFSSPPENTLIVSLASDRPLPMTLPSDCPIPFTVHGSDRPYPPMSISGCAPEYTASLAALENHVKGINSNVTHPLPFPPHFGLGLNMANYFRDYSYPQKSTASSPPASKNGSDISTDDRSTPGGATSGNKSDSPRSNANNSQSTPKSESSNGGGALDLTPRSSPAFQRPGATDVKIFAPLVGLPFGAPHHRMSTTCRVCYKTFACNSALEIHYRSHTKERPFRCEVCDRGFSTKGNMRQHMLTHKIRDLPAQVFSANTNTNSSSSNTSTTLKLESSGEKSPKKQPEEAAKRPPTENSLPLPQPKRSPGQPKHLCQVCNKPFSSGSALQIHMRTHTGDKPFQCHICHRAFTTKGNLKVHMGTHMWNNSTSRRGRRMSLDLGPLQLPSSGKPGDFPQTSYFPYLPPFMNGLPPPQPPPPPPPPKMNEISVIQTAGMTNGGAPPVTTSSTGNSQQPLALLSSASKQRDREESNIHQNQNQHSQGKDSHPLLQPTPEMAVSWPWKISCNICNKICSSSTELEMHIRNNHCKKESSDSDRTD